MTRVRVHGYRIHHGFVGCVLAALGAILGVHDRRDARHWWPERER